MTERKSLVDQGTSPVPSSSNCTVHIRDDQGPQTLGCGLLAGMAKGIPHNH